ncbi:hypothetical protein BT63DRAFT_190626 [Microthyrium microscopicum]|uniref:Uncharacterized protein n=1 Tax=Microthyrium microscopicum TaxID=703497 RepID=A0A6A6UL42_9PEZI|nr:hypothetical protein BT63DRAFT_190626 [Microthyrium microscopicum]
MGNGLRDGLALAAFGSAIVLTDPILSSATKRLASRVFGAISDSISPRFKSWIKGAESLPVVVEPPSPTPIPESSATTLEPRQELEVDSNATTGDIADNEPAPVTAIRVADQANVVPYIPVDVYAGPDEELFETFQHKIDELALQAFPESDGAPIIREMLGGAYNRVASIGIHKVWTPKFCKSSKLEPIMYQVS